MSSKGKNSGGGSFLWNPDTGEFLGRTGGSWFKIVVFYIIYYACLAGIFVLFYKIFATTLQDDQPKWTLDESLIGNNPGVGFRPLPDQDKTPESTLIWYQNKTKDYDFWVSQLNEFWQKVESVPADGKGVLPNCGDGVKASKKEACKVPLEKIKFPCTPENQFGYKLGEPCVLIKLNKIYAWEPEPYGIRDGKFMKDLLDEDLDEAEENGMPSSLVKDIKKTVKNAPPGEEEKALSNIWVTCTGENEADKEILIPGTIEYHPSNKIPGYYFPYYNQEYFRSPFVIVHFKLPESARKSLIMIECRAWARNIHYAKQERLGSVHFEILVDF